MTKEKAIESAKWCAKKYGKPYAIIQARNGQWMRERLEYLDSPVGRMSYGNQLRTKEVFQPD